MTSQMAAKRLETFRLDPMPMYRPSLGCMGCMFAMVTSRRSNGKEIKMAMSDVDVSSSLDHDEEPLAELTDEELYNLVQETM